MAVMYPKDLENYKCTATEKEMYFAFQQQLPDKFQVFYSVRWFETANNKRIDSECDFLVFDPSFGFLTIEVKGGTGIEIEDTIWYLNEYDNENQQSKRELKCSPYKQAEKSMRHFYNYFVEEFNQNFKGTYGFAAAFPRYKVDSSLGHEIIPELTIDIQDMDNLPRRINEIFHYWRNRRNIAIPFSAEQRQQFINSINKKISLAAAAGALIPVKQKQFAKINFLQEGILDVLSNYNQVKIVGGAGTGKTYIAMKKAIRDAENGKKVLILCCNIELIKTINKMISGLSNISSMTYEDIMTEILGEEYYKTPLNECNVHCCFEALSHKNHLKYRYDSIIVDEAQDFDIDMGLSVRWLLKDDKKSDLYVFYDKNQNLFERDFENAFAIEYPPFVLRYNIRNTGNIYNCATEKTGLGRETIANSLLGVQPEIQNYKNSTQSKKALTNIVNRLVQKELVSTSSIVILSAEKLSESILKDETRVGAFNISCKDLQEISDDEICFKTVEEFKGLEADIIIYLTNGFDNTLWDGTRRSKEYVALTRARYYLYILNSKRGSK